MGKSITLKLKNKRRFQLSHKRIQGVIDRYLKLPIKSTICIYLFIYIYIFKLREINENIVCSIKDLRNTFSNELQAVFIL